MPIEQIAAGYEDANDSNQLRHDPVFKITCDRLNAPLASQPTISRFENTFSGKDLYRIAEAFVEVFLGLAGRAPMSMKVQNLAEKAKELYHEKGQPVKLFCEL